MLVPIGGIMDRISFQLRGNNTSSGEYYPRERIAILSFEGCKGVIQVMDVPWDVHIEIMACYRQADMDCQKLVEEGAEDWHAPYEAFQGWLGSAMDSLVF